MIKHQINYDNFFHLTYGNYINEVENTFVFTIKNNFASQNFSYLHMFASKGIYYGS